jgi:WD40 repeat protein
VLRELNHLIQNGSVNSVAWTPDGKNIASGSGRTIKIWNAQKYRLVRPLVRRRVIVHFPAQLAEGAPEAGGAWERERGRGGADHTHTHGLRPCVDSGVGADWGGANYLSVNDLTASKVAVPGTRKRGAFAAPPYFRGASLL